MAVLSSEGLWTAKECSDFVVLSSGEFSGGFRARVACQEQRQTVFAAR